MDKAYDKAVKLLKIRPHHSSELTRKLLARGFDSSEVASVITKLQEENLIDNEAFAQNYLDELLRNKTLGFMGLKVKLLKRGIAGNEAEKLLQENFSIEKERENAQKLLDKWANLSKEKIAQRLSSRGFRSELIRDVLRSHLF